MCLLCAYLAYVVASLCGAHATKPAAHNSESLLEKTNKSTVKSSWFAASVRRISRLGSVFMTLRWLGRVTFVEDDYFRILIHLSGAAKVYAQSLFYRPQLCMLRRPLQNSLQSKFLCFATGCVNYNRGTTITPSMLQRSDNAGKLFAVNCKCWRQCVASGFSFKSSV